MKHPLFKVFGLRFTVYGLLWRLGICLFPSIALAQSGAIKGTVRDKDSNEPMPFVNVIVEQDGIQKGGAQSDFDGVYVIKPLTPGKYSIKASFIGYNPIVIQGVIVISDQTVARDIALSKTAQEIPTVVVETVAGPPLIDQYDPGGKETFTREDIAQMQERDVTAIAAQTAGAVMANDGLHFQGARSDATAYYVDGVKVISLAGIPKSSIDQETVLAGGIPAQYGDIVGGVVNITTRGPSRQFSGGADFLTSSPFDQHHQNLLDINLTGPLKTGYDTALKANKTVLGYFVTFEGSYAKDPFYSAVPIYKVNDDVLANLQQNPLRPNPQGAGFVPNAEYVTNSDLQTIGAHLNDPAGSFTVRPKIQWEPYSNIDFVAGGVFSYSKARDYTETYSLFNYANNPLSYGDLWSAYGRFTQKFGNSKESKSSSIKNAYYTVQFDYQNNYNKFENATLKDNLFEYGYLGKFQHYSTPLYQQAQDSATGKKGWVEIAPKVDTSVTFQRSAINALAANWTTEAYNLNPEGFHSDADITNASGLLNGNNPFEVFNLYRNTGRIYPSYGFSNNEQYRLTANGSADIGNHNIIAGMEYEQQVQRSYNFTASRFNEAGLWNLMRQLANAKNSQLDKAHPVFTQSGPQFTPQDTIKYNRLYTPSLDANNNIIPGFFENVRSKLGLKPTDWLDIDSYDPSVYSLNMFTPDELLNNGNSYTNAFGYDYLGNKLSSQPNFTDFFTKKDANGNYVRAVPAYEPIYVAGYIQDKFDFKDLKFNIGLRVDRFDANQKVLKDPYLLYETYTAGELSAVNPALINNTPVPSNIGSNYVVYVNDLNAPTAIVGYRNGSQWYDASGTPVIDPKIIAKATSTGKISPYLIHPESTDITPGVFQDYTPQNTFMPRIVFSFPISDEALFFAHYDVYSQRGTPMQTNPYDYLFMQTIAQGRAIPNGNILPQRTIDYQMGFKQKVSKTSTISLSAYYKQLKDLVQIMNVLYAYPIDYTTYGNNDFGTAKGFKVEYDLRRTQNVRILLNYTLGFADGTGSNPGSEVALLDGLRNNGVPNLRIPHALDYDQRHVLTAQVDYRFGSGKTEEDHYDGPIWFGKKILASTGANLIFSAHSGTPYTQEAEANPFLEEFASYKHILTGRINGANLPWFFNTNIKVDKMVAIREKGKHPMSLDIYIQARNLFNTKNILYVYPTTGSPSDDGSLTAAANQSHISAQTSAEAYRDIYTIKMNNPGNYSLPRIVQLGLQWGF